MTTATIDPPAPAREALSRREPEPMHQVTAEVAAVAPHVDLSLEPSTYVGMSEAPVTEEQAAILSRALEPRDVDLRPDGQVYMSHAKLRQRLNEAFRPGGWAIRRLSSIDVAVATPAQADSSAELVMSAEFALYAGGRFLSAARGEQKYYDNGDMTYGDAAEGMKSNAISRCCKDLGIALDLWDRSYADAWRNEHGVKVWGKDRSGRNWRKPQWRRVDGLPLYGETGPTDDSPNQDRYVHPGGDRHAPREERQEQPRPAPARPQAVPPRQEREPGDERDEDARPAPRQDPPRPASGGRKISEAQGRRLWAKATKEAGLSQDQYRDLLRRWGYDSDRDVLQQDYDAIIAEVER